MYQDHFGLRGLPFAETAAAEGFVPLPSREGALHRLRYGLEFGRGPVLLTGLPGTGKTRLAAVLERQLSWPVLRLDVPLLSSTDLPWALADELAPGVMGEGSARSGGRHRNPLRVVREALGERAARGWRTLLMLDEAHLISEESTFEALGGLQNFATEGVPDLGMVIVGAPELLLRLPVGLVDRLTARVILGPLEEREASAYLMGRLEAAGGSERLFDEAMGMELHRAADGLPRRMNRLADLSLLIAYAEGLARPDERCVRLAVRELAPDRLAA